MVAASVLNKICVPANIVTCRRLLFTIIDCSNDGNQPNIDTNESAQLMDYIAVYPGVDPEGLRLRPWGK